MITRFPLAAVLCLLAANLQADELVAKNGSVLIGKLISAEEGVVEFETPFAGRILIKEENIDRVRTDSNVTLALDNGEVLKQQSITAVAGTGELLATGDDGVPVRFSAVDILYINPEPWKIGDGWVFSGSARTALETERGNSDSDEWDIDARMVYRNLYNRFRFRGDAELEEAFGQTTSENWTTRFNYDRLNTVNDNYVGGRLRFEYDEFADLDLRTTVGPYLGRQFFSLNILNVRGEIGPVYVDEQFNVAEDRDFWGALWEFEVTSNVLGFGTELFAEHDGTLNFNSASEPLLNTTFGIRMPLIFGFQTGAQMKWEYNGGAPDDVDDLDETYNFFISYDW